MDVNWLFYVPDGRSNIIIPRFELEIWKPVSTALDAWSKIPRSLRLRLRSISTGARAILSRRLITTIARKRKRARRRSPGRPKGKPEVRAMFFRRWTLHRSGKNRLSSSSNMSKKSINYPLPNRARKTARAKRKRKNNRWLTRITMPNLKM